MQENVISMGFIVNADIPHSHRASLPELKWLSWSERLLFHKSIIMFKSLNNLTPGYISSLFDKNSTNNNLRSIETLGLILPKFKLMSFKKMFVIFWC